MQSLVVDRALRNLRAPKAACKLMKFYAARSDGFRPSLAMIDDAIDIGKKHVSTVRQMLVRYGLIAYDGKCVLIDWVRLGAFASMDTRLMGQKKNWKISPVTPNLLDEAKTGVHTYIVTGDFEARRLYAVYEATQQAICDGVQFPELRSEDTDNLLGCTKTGVHTYIGVGDLVYGPQGFQESVGWYNPFDEPDPDWVNQCAIVDAYGEIMGYMHYETELPF